MLCCHLAFDKLVKNGKKIVITCGLFSMVTSSSFPKPVGVELVTVFEYRTCSVAQDLYKISIILEELFVVVAE